MTEDVDLLVVGAGPVGCVLAERAAEELGWSCLIVERRGHLAGNCHDRLHPSGVLIHQYGPHYFRTDDPELLAYLSRFTEWIPGNYVVKSSVGGRLYPFPINLDTLEQYFGRELTPESAEELLAGLREEIPAPANSEEFVLSRVGRELYQNFYLGYTRKQWGIHPRDLDPSVCGRIPVRLNRDQRYVDQGHQVMPARGYTQLFETMVRHPRIRILLDTDYRELRQHVRPRRATVFCGPVDEYFDRRLGALPWRSLRFELEVHPTEYQQPCAQINYPNEHGYTRSFEAKHVTGQRHPATVVAFEFPEAVGDPYYPVPTAASRQLYQAYRELAEAETRRNRVHFTGRLATYRYLNTDQAILAALETFEELRRAPP